MSKEFEISKLLTITQKNKYEAAVAAFEVINNLDLLEFPKKVMNRKPAVKALMALSEEIVKYDYIDEEAREELEKELRSASRAQAQTALDAVFSTPGGAAPVADDSEEDLDEIGETAPVDALPDEDGEMEGFGEETIGPMGSSMDSDSDDDDDDDDDDDSDDNSSLSASAPVEADDYDDSDDDSSPLSATADDDSEDDDAPLVASAPVESDDAPLVASAPIESDDSSSDNLDPVADEPAIDQPGSDAE